MYYVYVYVFIMYILGDVMIKNVELIFDLGVNVAKNLKPSDQCLKASAHKIFAVIKLAFKFLHISTLIHLYKIHVCLLFEHCCIVRCYFYVKDIDLLVKGQHCFTRILPDYRNLPYKDRLTHYNLMSLYTRCVWLVFTNLFMIILISMPTSFLAWILITVLGALLLNLFVIVRYSSALVFL